MQIKIVPAVIIAAIIISSCNNNDNTKETEIAKTAFHWPGALQRR